LTRFNLQLHRTDEFLGHLTILLSTPLGRAPRDLRCVVRIERRGALASHNDRHR